MKHEKRFVLGSDCYAFDFGHLSTGRLLHGATVGDTSGDGRRHLTAHLPEDALISMSSDAA